MVLKGKLIKILDEKRVIVDIGYEDGMKKDMKFIIYSEGEEILDPRTNKHLGKMEIVKHKIKAVHVQEKISIMESDIWVRTTFDSLFAHPSFSRQKAFLLKDEVKSSEDEDLTIKVNDLVREDVS